jgi:acetyltransferase-like isoleucine patch superfamily enzyme
VRGGVTLGARLRTAVAKGRLLAGGARVGRNFAVHGPLDILLRDGASLANLTIGDDVTLAGKTYIRMRKDGRIVLGNGVSAGTENWFVAANDASLVVGDHTRLGSYSIFNGGHGLRIGAHSIFAAFVYVNTSDHGFARHDLIQRQGFIGAPIEIGEDVWLGGHVFVNKGTNIARGAVVGSGAVVTKDVPEYAIAVGNPARVIGYRE